MFTGLVEEKGTLVRRDATAGGGARIALRCTLGRREALEMGESISVDGCCLTVVAFSNDGFEIDASAETLARTTLGERAVGSEVNLERAAKLGQKMGGHIVSGHVDGVGRVVARRPLGDAIELDFEVPLELAKFVAEKGSICVDGVSLTVNKVEGARFGVAVIPHTRSMTTLDALGVDSRVNLEVDLLARYVARILEAQNV
jgi:riboflavin synthase